MNLLHINEKTIRLHMLTEVERDVASPQGLYMSSYFNQTGRDSYSQLLRAAIESEGTEWLAEQLQQKGCFAQKHQYMRAGRPVTASVPVTASTTLAEGEMNRFYCRALCIDTLDGNIEVYRAKLVREPRPESEQLIGKLLRASDLLMDLRNNTGVEAALGLARPNSGLSVRRPNL